MTIHCSLCGKRMRKAVQCSDTAVRKHGDGKETHVEYLACPACADERPGRFIVLREQNRWLRKRK